MEARGPLCQATRVARSSSRQVRRLVFYITGTQLIGPRAFPFSSTQRHGTLLNQRGGDLRSAFFDATKGAPPDVRARLPTGPIAALYKFETEEEAVAMANAAEVGLAVRATPPSPYLPQPLLTPKPHSIGLLLLVRLCSDLARCRGPRGRYGWSQHRHGLVGRRAFRRSAPPPPLPPVVLRRPLTLLRFFVSTGQAVWTRSGGVQVRSPGV